VICGSFLVSHDMECEGPGAPRARSKPERLPNSWLEMFRGGRSASGGGWPQRHPILILRGRQPVPEGRRTTRPVDFRQDHGGHPRKIRNKRFLMPIEPSHNVQEKTSGYIKNSSSIRHEKSFVSYFSRWPPWSAEIHGARWFRRPSGHRLGARAKLRMEPLWPAALRLAERPSEHFHHGLQRQV